MQYLQYAPIGIQFIIAAILIVQVVQVSSCEHIDIKGWFKPSVILKFLHKNLSAAILIQAVIFAVYSICNYVINTNKSQITIEFTYAELQQGLNPNGTRFNPQSMTQDEVLDLVIDDLGLQVSVDDLRKCIRVHNQGSQQELSATSQPKLTSEYKVSTTDEIYKYDVSAQELLTSFQECYKDYFVKTYAGNFSLLDLKGIDDVKNMDYLEMLDYFQMYQDNIQHLIDKFANENNTYKYNDTQFADLQKVLQSFESVTLERFKQFVLDNGLQKDESDYTSWVSYQNKLKDVQFQKLRAGYDIRLDAIKLYDEKMATVVLVPTRDTSDEFYMSRTQIGVDYLAEEANSYQNKATDIQNQISTNDYALSMINSQDATDSEYAQADNMCDSIITELKKMASSAKTLTTEYIKYKRDGYLVVNMAESQMLSLIDFKKGVLLVLACWVQLWMHYVLDSHNKDIVFQIKKIRHIVN